MEARNRNILSGDRFTSLFPKANLRTIPIHPDARLSHTLQLIPKVVNSTLWHTRKLASFLKSDSIHATCKNIWQFVYKHIKYQKDEKGKEQIRTPARVWNDRKNGVDCDCYSVFISSVLSNLKIPHSFRVTKYKEDHFQHIYPIVHLDNNKYITMDAVVDSYNYEVPFTQKKDIAMELEILNGIDDYELEEILENDSFDDFEDEDLEGLFKRKPGKKKKKGKVKRILGRGLNIINKVNPATVALRAGLLASMKLNILKVAQRIKYAYLSEANARRKGMDIPKWKRLVGIKDRMERLYYGAGGKKSKLKKAILTGKGNRNKEVPLSGFSSDMAVDHLHENMLLSEVLGPDIFESEFESDAFELNGLGDLGEPISAATIAAASGAVAAFAGLIKNIGNVFPKKNKESKDFELDSATQKLIETASAKNNIASSNPTVPAVIPTDSTGARFAPTGNDGEQKENFWQNNKKWLTPTLIGIGTLGALYAGFKIMKSKSTSSKAQSLNGAPAKKRAKTKRTYKKKNPNIIM